MSSDKSLKDWKGAKLPDQRILEGRFVRLEPLNYIQHVDQLWDEFAGPDSDPTLYDYLARGPFEHRAEFDVWLADKATGNYELMYAIIDLISGKAQGMAGYVRFDLAHGVMEIGPVFFGASMQKSCKSTETVFLMAQEAFALGYRRLQWMSSIDNARSKRAALRYGFTFEAVIRQHAVFKNRSWDSAVYSMLDREWPRIQESFILWLSPDNFDSDGRQIQTLEALRKTVV